MGRRCAGSLCAAMLAAGCATVGPGAGATPREEAVRAADRQRFAAMVARDLGALDTLLADELTYTHTTGDVDTKSSLLAALRAGQIAYDSIVPSGVEVRLYGDVALATGAAHMQVRAGGEAARRFGIRFSEVYVLRAGRWQLVAWQSTRLPEP